MKKFDRILIILAVIGIVTSLAFYPFLPDKIPNKIKNGVVLEEKPKSSAVFFSLIFVLGSFAVIYFMFVWRKLAPIKAWSSGWFSAYPEPMKKVLLGVSSFIFNEKFDINDYGRFYDFITLKYTRIFGAIFMLGFVLTNFVINIGYMYPSQVFSPQGILMLILPIVILTFGAFLYMARNHRKIGFISEE